MSDSFGHHVRLIRLLSSLCQTLIRYVRKLEKHSFITV